MSGDWIKMELTTPDKPEVWAIAEELNIDPDAAFGKLYRMWVWFDEHTENGNALSVSKKLIDRLVGVNGFCNSVISAGWMIEENGEIRLPNFDRHNGKTAKKRALTAKRVAKHSANAKLTIKALPREEKSKEINKEKNPPKRFIPPTVEDVAAYVKTRQVKTDPVKFVNHYQATGWMRGKNKIQDWKACVRYWEQGQKQRGSEDHSQDLVGAV